MATWTQKQTGITASTWNSASDGSDTIYAGASSGYNVWQYTLSTDTKTQIKNSGSFNGLIASTGLAWLGGNLYVAVMDTTAGAYRVYRYDGTPLTGWTQVLSVTYTNTYGCNLIVNGSQMVLTTCDGDVRYTTDGSSWSSGSTASSGSGIDLSPVNIGAIHARFYISSAYQIRRHDGSATWTQVYSALANVVANYNWIYGAAYQYSATWSGFSTPATAMTDIPAQTGLSSDVGLRVSGNDIYFHQFNGSAWDAGEVVVNNATLAGNIAVNSSKCVRFSSGEVLLLLVSGAGQFAIYNRDDPISPPVASTTWSHSAGGIPGAILV